MSFTAANEPRPAMTARGGANVTYTGGEYSPTYPTCKIWVGSVGDLKLLMADGTTVTFDQVPSNTMLEGIMATKIYEVAGPGTATGTEASELIAFWG